ncbi:protoporphyrinogen oxidase [Paenibacillus prosopidis]|uniref:Coproporphyrinogen III oxidase n=1 Tax=Paenibacillus prosopidis TaxID=630520 RepID=A0A368W0Y3_9BACL|nr:protoporphyrinogen oxidase [Paenibacillus prosopidis]RCW45608.1 oxygen-dependent protoporphyrinogen oxidase [Paenibacillus prosopidis]
MRRIGNPDRIVIIGGGISGLSSAFYLQREAERQGKDIEITIIDGSPVFGGKINTLQRGGFVIEKGPDSFLARKLAIIDLAKELGIEEELTTTNPGAKKTYILHDRKLFPMPPGLVLGIPTEIGPFAMTGLLSWGGKLRALLDLVLPVRKEQGDESLGGFLERRVGTQVMRRIAEPLLAGIYAGDLKKLSLQATFPQFAAAERKHGSLIRGMQHNRKASAAAAALPAIAKGGTFLTFKGGLSTLVNALEEALSGAQKRLGVKVTEIRKADAGDGAASGVSKGLADSRYEVVLDSGERLQADRIVMTAPAYDAADLLGPLTDCRELRAINYVSVANVVMAFDKATFGLDFDGSGFVVPRSEGLHITACTWTSNKWLHTSPDDKVLLRCYVGRSGDEESVKLSDEELLKAVRSDIKKTMGITSEPLFTEITRLPRSMPQYPVGHVDNMKRLRSRLEQDLPGIWVTGAAFDGVGLPDCIRQGKEAAQAILAAE